MERVKGGIGSKQEGGGGAGGRGAILSDFLHDLDAPSGRAEQRGGGFFGAQDGEALGIVELLAGTLKLILEEAAFHHAARGIFLSGKNLEEYVATGTVAHLTK